MDTATTRTSSIDTASGWRNREGVALQLLDAVLSLPVEIDRLTTTQLRLPSPTWPRTTTLVQLHGAGETGTGEDIAYSGDTQAALPAAFAKLDLTGAWTIGSLAEHLDAHELALPPAPTWDDKPGYHRWAIESAALDLALRQRGSDLAALVGAAWEPMRWSLSMGLGDPASTAVLERWLERDASITFKLDTSAGWDHALVGELAKLGAAVATIDFKGLYHGDWADNDASAVLYEAVGHGLRGALVEDARLSAEVQDALDEDALRRLSWDFPITGPHDVPGLPASTATFSDLRPAAINIKPSRFGSFERLLGTIALCDREGIPCYSGGQYELGIGRTQVQSIASLCFPEGPNDCAPVMFHGADPADTSLPLARVAPPAGAVGFGWDAPTPAGPVTD